MRRVIWTLEQQEAALLKEYWQTAQNMGRFTLQKISPWPDDVVDDDDDLPLHLHLHVINPASAYRLLDMKHVMTTTITTTTTAITTNRRRRRNR
jgi:hypothetical protein